MGCVIIFIPGRYVVTYYHTTFSHTNPKTISWPTQLFTERPLNLPVHYWLLQGHFSWHSQLHWNPTWFLESSGCSTSYNFHSYIKILKFNKILTPFWKAIEWIWMMLFLERSRISSRCRSQKIASGTDVKLFPERSKYLREVPNECKSSRFNSEMKLSEKNVVRDHS